MGDIQNMYVLTFKQEYLMRNEKTLNHAELASSPVSLGPKLIDTSLLQDSEIMIYSIFLAIYASSIAMAGPHGSKLVQLGPLVFDAGLITYSLCFIVTDIVSEVYGKSFSKKIILASFWALIFVFVTTRIALWAPPSPGWDGAGAYDYIFGVGSRVFIAALISFVLSQITDIYVFAWIKAKTGAKYL